MPTERSRQHDPGELRETAPDGAGPCGGARVLQPVETSAEPTIDVRMALLDGVQDFAVFTLDPSGQVTSWNEGARRMTGFDADDIVGRSVKMLYVPEDADRPAREMAAALANGRSEDENWHVRKDGSRFWSDEVMTPIRAADGTLRGFTKISRDLTERRRAADRLRQSEERLRLVMESVQDYAILTLDTDGVVDSWNTGAERIFGVPASEMIGRRADIVIFTPEDRTRAAYRRRSSGRHGRRDGPRTNDGTSGGTVNGSMPAA